MNVAHDALQNNWIYLIFFFFSVVSQIKVKADFFVSLVSIKHFILVGACPDIVWIINDCNIAIHHGFYVTTVIFDQVIFIWEEGFPES